MPAPAVTSAVTLIECPRDAMQGWKTFIPTAKKIDYLNALLGVGFDTLDCGSFVSPKAIPQLSDTKEVIPKLNLEKSTTKLLAIVANVRGAEDAMAFDEITYLGFPFSLSPTFQLRNTNSTIAESTERIEAIQHLCLKHNKRLVVYLSMGFGNPYGDSYNEDILLQTADEMVVRGITILSLADTVGVAKPTQIHFALTTLIPKYPGTTSGGHLHTTAQNWREKVAAAYDAGCRRFDGALKGIGGCPMANDELVGNMDSERLIQFFDEKKISLPINRDALQQSIEIANTIFV